MLENGREEVKLEGKLKENISPPYQSKNQITFYVARLVDLVDMEENSEEEFTLFFWDDGRFDEEAISKIKNLTAGDDIAVYAEKRTNPRDGRIIYHVKKLGEETFEVFS